MSSSISIPSVTTSGSGLDVQATVDQLMQAAEAPEQLMQQQQNTLDQQTSAFNDLSIKLSDLDNKLTALGDFTGALNARSADSSQPSLVTAAATGQATTGNHIVVVSNLASTASWFSDSQSNANATLSGSFTLQVGPGTPVTISIDSTRSTLSTLASYINQQKLGVSASVVADSSGSRLVLVSQSSGSAGDIKITDDSTELGMQQGSRGRDASLTVDGVPATSSTNTVTGIIPGVTLNLAGSDPNQQVLVSVSFDSSGAQQALSDFVTSYNALISAINDQFKVDPNTNQGGVLDGDSDLRRLQDSLLSAISYSMTGNNGYVNLQSIGLEMQDDGTLQINSTQLNDVLANHAADLVNFFQNTSGFASAMENTLDALNAPTTGVVSQALNEISTTKDDLTQSIADFEARMDTKRQLLTAEYTQVDTELRELPMLQQQISAQLASLPSSK